MSEAPEISVVIPALDEAQSLPILIPRLRAALAGVAGYEIIVVDDGSRDQTFALAKGEGERHKDVRVLRLSRRFGHQSALLAGLRAARGRAIVTMDADLQHPPELLPTLIEKWRQGHQVVHTRRADAAASGGLFKRLSSSLFYRGFAALSRLPIEPGMADFRLIDRRALTAALASNESRVFLRGLFVWVGFEQVTIPYTPGERVAGDSHFSLLRMVRLGLVGMLSFSELPLYWSLLVGVMIAFLSMCYGLYAIGIRLFTDSAVPGWSSLLALVAFLFGVQFVLIGVLGAYVAAIYAEVKARPPYVIADEYPGPGP